MKKQVLKDNPILKVDMTEYKYATRLDFYAEEAGNYTDHVQNINYLIWVLL